MTGRSLTSNTYQASRPRCATLSTDRHNSPKTRLGWEPRTSLDEMIAEMVESDLATAKKNRLLRESGYEVNHARE